VKNPQSSHRFKNNPLVKHDLEAILIGIMFMLIAGLGILNMTPVSGFLSYLVTILIGNLNFLGFGYLAFLGFYRIVKRKPFRLRFNLAILGMIFVAVSVLGLMTHYTLSAAGLDAVDANNFLTRFFEFVPPLKEIPVDYADGVSGGLFGYMMAGLMNSIAGPNGGIVLLYIIFAIGLLLALKSLWIIIINFIQKHHQDQQAEKERLAAARQMERARLGVPETKIVPKSRPTTSFVPDPTKETPLPYTRPTVAKGPSSGLRKLRYGQDAEVEGTNKTESSIIYPSPSEPVTPMPRGTVSFEKTTALKRPTVSFTMMETPVEATSFKEEAKPVPHQEITAPKESFYDYPPIDLIDDVPEEEDFEYNDEVSMRRLQVINQTFIDLNVKAAAVSYQVGPSFTSFDIQLERGTLVKSVATIINEISIRLGGMPALFTEVVPGKTTSTLEVPNEKVSIVSFKDIIRDIDTRPEYANRIVLPFGKNILGKLELLPLKDIIHMLVAGTTGSGKSVFMHTLIMTVIMRSHPRDIRLLIIDPKRVEMSRYNDIPHLLAPIINDYGQAKIALTRLYEEMAWRYELFKQAGISSIDAYNRYARDNGQDELPLILTIIDEYADLVEGVASISDTVERLAALSRASGIHMIIATQRPITRVVSGNIKNNIMTKVALQMAAPVDSVTVLGHAGAEKLLGNGDMIVSCPKLSRYGELRLQGAFVSEDDTWRVVSYVKERYPANYHPNFENLVDVTAMGPAFSSGLDELVDEKYDDIKQYTMTQEYMSSSRLIRQYGMGFNRSKQIIAQLQAEGILAPGPDNPQSNKGIKVLVRTNDDGNPS
jgi:DNA segregation ATPase FtsK/SpoIIIE-like protein